MSDGEEARPSLQDVVEQFVPSDSEGAGVESDDSGFDEWGEVVRQPGLTEFAAEYVKGHEDARTVAKADAIMAEQNEELQEQLEEVELGNMVDADFYDDDGGSDWYGGSDEQAVPAGLSSDDWQKGLGLLAQAMPDATEEEWQEAAGRLAEYLPGALAQAQQPQTPQTPQTQFSNLLDARIAESLAGLQEIQASRQEREWRHSEQAQAAEEAALADARARAEPMIDAALERHDAKGFDREAIVNGASLVMDQQGWTDDNPAFAGLPEGLRVQYAQVAIEAAAQAAGQVATTNAVLNRHFGGR